MWHTNGSNKSPFPGSKGVAHVFAPKKMKVKIVPEGNEHHPATMQEKWQDTDNNKQA